MYPTLNDYNMSAGAENILIAAADISPMLFPMILFGFFIIVMMGTLFSYFRLTNRLDFSSAFVAASFSTLLLSFIMSLIDGLINGFTIAVCIAVFIISILVLFFHEREQ